MFSKLNFLGVANATKTTAVVASATTSAKAVAGVATSAKKTGAVKKFTALMAMALVAFSLTACGGGDYCDDKEAKNLLLKSVKDALLQENDVSKTSKTKQWFAEQVSKVEVLFGKVSTTNINKEAKKSSCAIDKIGLKFGTSDTLFYDNNNSGFEYSVRKSDNGIRVNADFLNKLTRIDANRQDGLIYARNDILLYYFGLGIMIDGVRKGGCNGKQQILRDDKATLEIECANGLRNGIFTSRRADGTLQSETSYAQGLIDGETKTYYENGKIQSVSNTIKGVNNGAYKMYYNDGKISLEGNYKQGMKDGAWKEYYTNGKLGVESHYADGLKTGVEKWYDGNGLLVKEKSYKNDLLDGMSKKYYPLTGRVKYSINYTEGKKNGTFERYNEDGSLHSALSFKMDIIDGKAENNFASFYGDESTYLQQEYGYDEKEIRDLMRQYDLWNIVDNKSKLEFKDGVPIYANSVVYGEHIFSGIDKLVIDRGGNNLTLYRDSQKMGGYDGNGNLFGLCEQKGKCEEMFKELIDRSEYKDKIYSILKQTK